jgi:hypothetical protein
VINLDRRKDRWDTFFAQPTVKEFSNIQRFSAVDGSKIDVKNDKRIGIQTRVNIFRKYRRSDYEINTAGAIGASLSHFTLWENFLKSDAQHLVVFEDDTIVDEPTMAKIDKLIPTLPNEWDMWLLGTHNWEFHGTPLDGDKNGWWKVRNFTGAHAYVLTRNGAKILMDERFPIQTHVEYYITACAELKGLRIIRHASLRQSYFAELGKTEDSDTFDSRDSCPVCIVPDNFMYTGYYLSPVQAHRASVALLAIGIIGYGIYRGWKKLGK